MAFEKPIHRLTLRELLTDSEKRTRDLLEHLLEEISEQAQSAAGTRALDQARRRLDSPHPRRQRATVARGGLEALLAESADLTEAGAHTASRQRVGNSHE